jgi:hypothetical protein
MGFFFVVILIGLVVHGTHSYQQHRLTEASGNAAIDAVTDSLVWGFCVYLVSMALLIAFVIFAAYFGWFQ